MRWFITIIVTCIFANSTIAGPRFRDSDPVVFNTPAPHQYPIHGIDAARFQTMIDWPKARKAGINFAFIKATEGGDLLDPMFQAHWYGAQQAGVPVGAYHFYYFCTPARVQARWFIRNVPKVRGALPPVLDMEWNPFSPTCKLRPPAAQVRRDMKVFMGIIEKHYGKRPIIYTTPVFFKENGLGRLKGEEFWLRSTARTPAESYPDQNWQFWQYTSTGIVDGIEGGVDINVFNGNRNAWKRWMKQRSK
ncbi:glycoside hydrolase family 25 protein [Lentibacter sp. XHP0401]|jgi:lysozyme|uniref:glycoside hydrolase family 25 protein n=1 Tax=Lentibacter sp. XHP0401 TaxID=2984334 RepID=UPI0021E8D96A|nr:glycoside hydrolase family 25 protein [Lentibacter sp. XHP0401]MCV2893684.1 glycoside hydrolase family 25 protein [Lentibacter sp. XHP0401]